MQLNRDPLSKISIFAGLDLEALERLSRRAIEMDVRQDSVICSEGETGNQMFLILSGGVRVCKQFGTDREVVLARLTEGDSFGEMCILDTLPRSATVVAETDTTLFAINSLAFLELYEAMPKQYGLLVLNIARDLSRRLRELDATFAALS